ncbi:type II toxin-antitoxin system VapC family toxin [Aeromicrobium sp. Leaf350]|uniref:type II toxin-antitoxin system VapC family toxin n=1 Tax=Aeromicrobium sp. Leaf350 TaxID=2876565 RepID=UPI001E39406F|nr:type II toxin-antitoxin system VapC family toxin [Aeromicrobium sp. Leaf350]
MVSFVLDVSSTLPLVYSDESGTDTEEIRQAFTQGTVAFVPTLWRYELCNALRKGERRGRIAANQSRDCLEILEAHPIKEVETSSAFSLIGASRVHDLTAYDTAYLLLAQRLALPLATRDERLRDAARAGEVDLF